MNDEINEFRSLLLAACEGTSVTTRELIKAFSPEEITLIKAGDISFTDIQEVVSELADTKDNETAYKIAMKKRAVDDITEDTSTETS